MKVLFLAFQPRKVASARIRAWNMADSWSDADCLLAPDFFDFRTVTYQTAEAYDCFVYQKISVS